MLVNERKSMRYVSYDFDGVFSSGVSSIADWVCGMINDSIVSARVVTLKDTSTSNHDGNSSVQLKTPINSNTLIQEIKNRDIDIISFDGRFQSVPVSVSVNLNNYKLSVAFNKSQVVEAGVVEQKMRLNNF